jgi:hypothetical protein
VGVVPGCIGANGTTGPYSNPFGSGGYCRSNCVPQDYPNQNDGYKACHGHQIVAAGATDRPRSRYSGAG